VGLLLLGHQADGAFEFKHGLGISVEGQEAGAEQQSRGTMARLKSKRLTKSFDSFRVLAAQLSNDTKVYDRRADV